MDLGVRNEIRVVDHTHFVFATKKLVPTTEQNTAVNNKKQNTEFYGNQTTYTLSCPLVITTQFQTSLSWFSLLAAVVELMFPDP